MKAQGCASPGQASVMSQQQHKHMEQAETLKASWVRQREKGGGVKGERGQRKVSEQREQGEGLFEGLVDTQEELYCTNIPQIFNGAFTSHTTRTKSASIE